MTAPASAALPPSATLDPSGPIRAELLGPDHLTDVARRLAALAGATGKQPAHRLLHRLRDNEAVLRRAKGVIVRDAAAGDPLTPDAEWLLDNFFVIEDVFREIRTDLPRGYYRELPAIAAAPWDGLPRVYALASLLIAHTDSHLDEAGIVRFVAAFQERTPLTTGELWAVPTMLRLALLENLRRLADGMLAARAERRRAVEWVDRAVSAAPPPFPDDPSDAFLVAWHAAVRDHWDELPPGSARDLAAERADDLAETLRREHRRQAADQVSVGNAVTSLRLLNAIDWAEFFERTSPVEATLRAEPTGVYRRQDFATRDRYRRAVEGMAKAARRDEVEVAREAIRRAAAGAGRAGHVGYHLIDDGRAALAADLGCRFPFRDRWRAAVLARPQAVFFGGVGAVTAALALLAAAAVGAAGGGAGLGALAALVAVLPASEAAVALVNFWVTRALPPRVLPKLDFAAGIPDDARTAVVIPGMLTSPDSGAKLAERLELHYLANPDPRLRFALLTDWADAPTETTAKDQALVDAAVEQIRRLNRKYAPGGPDLFFLFHRARKWNPAEGVWMGWERKRGKLDEFNRLVRGATDTTYTVRTGDLAAFRPRFVLTLDADTVLPRDAARRLVATLAHPLNQPVLSDDGRRVAAGYGLLQPRVSFLYRTGLRSAFARIFAGSAGIDPYSSASSDVYQDLFGWGTFTGKGLYDVDAFHASAGRAFPDNAILSHDLIESNFARCGLVTDVELFDDFPAKYHAYAKREHRWIRGDWQLLPWLGRRVPTPAGRQPSVLTPLGRWKVLDNLRRSLVPPALVAFLAVGWLVLPGSPWLWTLAAAAVLALPIALQLYSQAVSLVYGAPLRAVVGGARYGLLATVGQVGLSAVFLANQAAIALDAIARTLWRLVVSRRRMLEWETAAAAEARLGTGLRQFVRSMWQAVAVALVLGGLVGWLHPAALPAALPWLLAWLVSPWAAFRVSQPLPDVEPPLTAADRAELRRTARKTWRFFEAFVTAEDHWLPPDNFQEEPKGVVAHRTSPTNKGLLLLSTLSAHDLGYVTLPEAADRFGKTFDTFEKLERFRGHFLNWYDTVTLKPLPPAYVSTVDSGNFLGCLLAAKNGLREKAAEPVPSPAAADGIADALTLVGEHLPKGAGDLLRAHLHLTKTDLLGWAEWLDRAVELADRLPEPDGDGGAWVRAVRAQAAARRDELHAVCPWVGPLFTARAAGDAPDDRWTALCDELNAPAGVRRWAERLPELRAELERWAKGVPTPGRERAAEGLIAAIDQSTAPALAAALDALGGRAAALADAMDFRFLFNDARQLFSIGYNVPLDRLDPGHYDLLASESAITSFLAVARGVVRPKHWFQLGRLTTRVAGLPGLISWGGTMFEYLMPRLLLAPAPGTMLDTAQKAAVARQIEYGRENGVPWGISESGFYVLSAEGDYQYQSFGVPGLGLKRGLAKDLVIAPYATLLAIPIDAAAAVANFGPLRAAGGEGPYGFYEAIDFTTSRLEPGERCRVVRSYMAHHQGMGLCAAANRLTGDAGPRRLRAEPAVRAVELLLQERVPLDAPEVRPGESVADVAAAAGPANEPAVRRRLTRADTPQPRAHLLSNGQYTVMLTNAGGGFSTCRGLAVTRWRNDPTRDHYGTFVYVRDAETGKAWSAGHQPLGAPADYFEVLYAADKAEFRRRTGDVETWMEVAVAPDRDVEVRRVTLINHDAKPHTLEVTSYLEPVLQDPRADVAHPAFGKLFLETEWLPAWDALLCRRRPRSPDQAPVWAVHVVAHEAAAAAGLTGYETDRGTFLGRRRSPADPDALARPLNGSVGPVLDPVLSLRRTVTLAAGARTVVTFATAVADSRAAAEAVADQYHHPAAAGRAFELAWAHSRVELRHLGLTVEESHLYQRLAGHMLYPPAALRSASALTANRQGQPGLWRYGISGDLPILAVCVADTDGLPVARQALKAHAFWRGRGFPVDVLLLADRPASYREELYEHLAHLARTGDCRDLVDRPGGVFVRKAGHAGEDRPLLLAAARVVLYGDRGSLADQIDALGRGRKLPAALVPTKPAPPEPARVPYAQDLQFWNGTGGFSPDGREYVVVNTPPAPWSNVIANPNAGCLTTDSGIGFAWAGNSQSNKLTPWSNDPVEDPPAAAVYLRDEETGAFWSPTPLPCGGPAGAWHGAGYTSYAQERGTLVTELTVFVPPADPVQIVRLKVHNRGDKRRRLSAAFFAEWVLGPSREQTAPYTVTELDPDTGALLARNPFAGDFGSAVAFADTSLRPRTLTGDRTEFLGRNRSPANPAALGRADLSGHVGPGLDPCAALHGRFEVNPGGTAVVVFVLGQGADAMSAARLADQYRRPEAAEAALRDAITGWDRRLSAVRVKTPDRGFDLLVNRWLPYQVLSCRVWGRSAFYQSGGAYGFRDQLQDVLALLYAEPGEARAQLLRAAARQFVEGDVQHWWHPPTGRGVRTRFSDDFLWLPYAAARYSEVTADTGVFDEVVPFLRGPQLPPDRHEDYFTPDPTNDGQPLYRHCLKALENGWKLGPHGLPLMGCGDWNDGMNHVGPAGRGESVWVAWFQIHVRTRFAAVADALGDRKTAAQLRDQAEQLRKAVEAHAWDGDWYLRAWFDDGTPLGSKANDECRIDSLPQSWAVLSGAADPARAGRAVGEAVRQLVDPAARLIRLFVPPFDAGRLQPGYIKGYVPGIRENGGQYTHAALWLVQAVAGLGRADEAVGLWRTISPVAHSDTPERVADYRVEPYVVAADVYARPPHVGRGGWTWYTGSAAWMYRAAVETILGLTRRGAVLAFDPRTPGDWAEFAIDYRHGSTVYRIRGERSAAAGVCEIWLDGNRLTAPEVPLADDGRERDVRVVLPSQESRERA
jgi:cyclic beta-1,2-glucan synthetase